MRAVRAQPDSGVTVEPQELVLARLRAHSLKRERREANRLELKKVQHRVQQWEPWQAGLIALAGIIRDKELAETVASANRHAAYRYRAAATARAKRRNDVTLAAPKARAGRPANISITRLLKAGAKAHHRDRVSYRALAAFMVDTVSRFLSPTQRSLLLGAPPSAQQKMRLASRLRQMTHRHPALSQ